jgi:hypothetical protein
LEELVAFWLATVTVTGPLVAPAGTAVVMLVDELAVTEAGVPLNVTILFEGVALKFVPEMMIVAPARPLVGRKLAIVGGGMTAKLDALVPV